MITRTMASSSNDPVTSGDSKPSSPSPDALANKETFLKLLVTQIRNQNPLNPMDGTQFVSQLAQFSQLEQSIAMRQDLDKLAGVDTTSSNASQDTAGGL